MTMTVRRGDLLRPKSRACSARRAGGAGAGITTTSGRDSTSGTAYRLGDSALRPRRGAGWDGCWSRWVRRTAVARRPRRPKAVPPPEGPANRRWSPGVACRPVRAPSSGPGRDRPTTVPMLLPTLALDRVGTTWTRRLPWCGWCPIGRLTYPSAASLSAAWNRVVAEAAVRHDMFVTPCANTRRGGLSQVAHRRLEAGSTADERRRHDRAAGQRSTLSLTSLPAGSVASGWIDTTHDS
jgi:hypothetical protein